MKNFPKTGNQCNFTVVFIWKFSGNHAHSDQSNVIFDARKWQSDPNQHFHQDNKTFACAFTFGNLNAM